MTDEVRPRPRLVPAAVAAVLAVVLVAASLATDEAPAADATTPLEPAPTPVLSARRTPSLLAAPVGEDRLRLALEPVLAGSPDDTCLVVRTGGRTIVAHNPDLPLVPASNEKLLTAHAALAVLGADHTWRTTVVVEEAPVEGVVDGDLHLVGGGDPVLATSDFLGWFDRPDPVATSLEALADAVVEAGVVEITGGVRGDEARYDDRRTVDGWPSRTLGDSRPGPLGALMVNRGFDRYPTSPDDRTSVSLARQPAVDAAATFDDLLEERGVTIRASAGAAEAPAEGTTLASIESPPLRDVVAWSLQQSDNTIAELLVKELGHERTGVGTTADGLAVVAEQVRAVAGDAPGLVVADGSGLHDEDRVTCSTLRAVLDAAGPDSPLGEGLAVAGESGTLRNRYVDTLVAGRLRAKTGYVNEATALSGFVTTFTGQELTFAYVANDGTISPEVVALQDPLGAALVRYPEGIDLEALAPPGAPPDETAVEDEGG